jgi:protein involved in sex pheromone biosynthesis
MKKLFILSLAALPMILSGCPKDEEPNTEKVEKAVDDAKDAADDEK